jgi:hypothetical protein
VIAFGIAVSTVLGRFVIPIYYVLGERLRARGTGSTPAAPAASTDGDGHPLAAVPDELVAAEAGAAKAENAGKY